MRLGWSTLIVGDDLLTIAILQSTKRMRVTRVIKSLGHSLTLRARMNQIIKLNAGLRGLSRRWGLLAISGSSPSPTRGIDAGRDLQ